MRLILWCILIGLTVCLMLGCGGGLNALTGGSVPIGDIGGNVYYAPTRAAGLTPAANIPVTLYDANGGILAATLTDDDGHFAFPVVLVTTGRIIARDALGNKVATLDITPDSASGFDAVMVLDTVVPGLTTIAIAPADVPNMVIGEAVTFTATSPDVPDALYPSWAVRGQIGTITPTGVFTATKQGAGKVIAQVGDVQTIVKIKVSKPDGQ